MERQAFDLATIRERLDSLQGKQFWRSLDELAQTEEFQQFVADEFPRQAAPWLEQIDRRSFLKLLGASLALAGLTGCGMNPEQSEKIVPYVKPPEKIVPGKPLFFATAVTLGGIATGVLVESDEGRPTKLEGNPDHPGSLGATDVFTQASILTLYDPDRAQVVKQRGLISTWDEFLTAFNRELGLQQASDGAGLRILTETVTSPTMADQLRRVLDQFPSAQWHQYEPVNHDAALDGARMAFGEAVNTVYAFDQAEVVLALDADFLPPGAGSVRYARDFAQKRRVRADRTEMNRLYVVESTPTLTGAMADHRLPLRAGQIEAFTRAIAQELGVTVDTSGGSSLQDEYSQWIGAVVRDLQEHSGAGIVVAGDYQPPIVHALVHAINDALVNAGSTVIYTQPVEAQPVNQNESLRSLVDDMNAGDVDLLVMLGGNPVYNAPADLQFAEALDNVSTRVHLGLHENETSVLSHWHIPATHTLEAWSDARAYDGTVTIMQPLIDPLYDGKSAHEMLAALLGETGSSTYDIVRSYWQGQGLEGNFETAWQTAVHDGVVPATAFTPISPTLQFQDQRSGADAGASAWANRKLLNGLLQPLASVFTAGSDKADAQNAGQNLEIIFRPDPTVWDGRFTNNGWLQEIPKPITKLTWDNAALMSPATAERLGLDNHQVVELTYNERSVRAPVWITPGHVDDAVTVHLGYGRQRVGHVGAGAGFDAYTIRTSDAPWFGAGLELSATGEEYILATTQHHQAMEGRHLIRIGTIGEFEDNPEFVHEMGEAPPRDETLYPNYEYDGYAWGMSIDLNTCIGCSACTIACQAENNIPVVGKEQVRVGREMHWIRIDRYFEGLDTPETYHQPVPCMHCENAPCEPVCPVAATVHDHEGINQMVYNRCVGTRYCSNNCPYKVRRFNFLHYSNFEDTPVMKLMQNPNVTVRGRGVMEKCTYCIQRINQTRIEAEKAGRDIAANEIQTACQQVCPTNAIVFGDINNAESDVTRLKAEPHNYGILTETNTRPRTTYLAKFRNPNPELEAE